MTRSEARAGQARIEQEPERREREAGSDEEHFLGEHGGDAEGETAREDKRGPSIPAVAGERKVHRGDDERGRGDVGAHLEALRKKERGVAEEKCRDESGARVSKRSSEEERGDKDGAGKDPRQPAREKQEGHRFRRHSLDVEEAEERGKEVVVPGRVVVEVIEVGDHAFRHAPGPMNALELVGIEAAGREKREAEEEGESGKKGQCQDDEPCGPSVTHPPRPR